MYISGTEKNNSHIIFIGDSAENKNYQMHTQ